MKKALAFLLLLLSGLAFGGAYVRADGAQRFQMEHATRAAGQQFVIPGDPRLADPVQIYAALLDAARETKVNVFRTKDGFTPDDRPEVVHYVLLTGPSSIFDALGLKAGRWPTPHETQSSTSFLSTTETASPAQIGTVRDFGGNDLVSVRSLKTAYDSLAVDGEYYAETTGSASRQQFLEVLADKITSGTGSSTTPLTAADFADSATATTGGSGGGGDPQAGSYSAILTAVSYLLVLVTTILLVYYLLYEAKRIGVMKLHGLGIVRVWFLLAGRLILATMLVSAVAALLGTLLVTDRTEEFLPGVTTSLMQTFFVMLTASLISCAYIARVKVGDSVKNRKDTKGVFVLNAVLKAACSVLLIVVGVGLWNQYSDIADKQASIGNWENTKDYAVFYPAGVGNDRTEMEAGRPGPTAAQVYDLYPKLNAMGSVFIETMSYEKDALTVPTNPQDFRSIKANPNYLSAFPLRDTSGRTIDVAEDTSDWVVLAPVKYQDREAQILEFFQRKRSGSKSIQGAHQAEHGVFNRTAPASITRQRVRVVWTANDQRVFSFNPLVYPDEGNVISDPIIQVVTSKNSLGIDRANMITGGGGNDGLKVRLTGRDAATTLKTLGPTLKGMKLDDNLKHLVTVNEFVLSEISDLQKQMRQVALVALAVAVGLLVLVGANLAIVFETYRRKFVVRRLFGAGFWRTYKEFLLLFALLWALQMSTALLLNRAGFNIIASRSGVVPGEAVVLSAAMVVVLAEFVFSVAALAFIEKRNLVKVLKGGF
jgi:putative ABC transport system permease protein